MKTQWEKRVDLTILIYQYLLLESTKQEIIDEALINYNFDAEQIKILEYVCDNKQQLIDSVKPYLEISWTWDRIPFVDRAIILEAISEYKVLKTHKSIIIDQALITAKNYNVDNNYKYINAILDKVL